MPSILFHLDLNDDDDDDDDIDNDKYSFRNKSARGIF